MTNFGEVDSRELNYVFRSLYVDVLILVFLSGIIFGDRGFEEVIKGK